jgi:hypothetical protein
VFLMCGQSLWGASGRVIVNEIVARRCIVAEPTTSPEQRDGELRSALEQIQSVMAVPALRCSLMSSSLALSIMFRSAHVPILDRLLPRASPTRMWRSLMVTSLLGFPPNLGNPHVSVPLKCIYSLCPATVVLRDTY